ncbi:Hypothetical predicted protein [Cloeon dipterum]|uniref:Uncharacterized protein n=1 Tax=Cloeon dipterum TaxID=197152 RepID=A0A8S1CEF9_9INSE|nr:Hypothetical predicted protein [Cloeon dipterum]
MEVALYGNLEMVKIQVAKGADANIGELTEEYGASVIHFAAANKKHGIEIVKYFASLDWDVNQEDDQGEVPLDYAIAEEAFAVAKEIYLLIDMSPESNLLHYCVMENKLDAAKKVHNRYNELVNGLTSDGAGTIHLAAQYADQQMCEWLIDDLGIDIRSLNVHLKVNVMYYVCFNHEFGDDLVKFFIERGLNVDDVGDNLSSPIHQAIVERNVDVINALIDCNADLKFSLPIVKLFYEKQPHLFEETFRGGKTIAHRAAKHGDLEVFQWLVEEAKVNTAKADERGQTVLHHAAKNEKHGKTLVCYIISKMGTDVNVICKRALNLEYGGEVINYLHNFHSLDVNLKSLSGETPILLAVKGGNVGAVEQLCNFDADLTAEYNGVNLVHMSIIIDSLEVAKVLHKHNLKLINEKFGADGKNALHVAAELGNHRFCTWLVEEGVNVKAKTKEGKSVTDLVPWFNLRLLKYLKNIPKLRRALK